MARVRCFGCGSLTPTPYWVSGQHLHPGYYYPEQPAISHKKNTVFFSRHTKTQNTKRHICIPIPLKSRMCAPPGSAAWGIYSVLTVPAALFPLAWFVQRQAGKR